MHLRKKNQSSTTPDEEKETRIQKKLDAIHRLASVRGEEDLLDNFKHEYLKAMIRGPYKKASPSGILKRLRRSERARHELHCLEREMDKDIFKKLVTSGYLVRSGRENPSGEQMFWIRLNEMCKYSWRLKVDSGEGKAYIRATVWLFESVTTQIVGRFGCTDMTHGLCMDLGTGQLNFHPLVTQKILRLIDDVIPIQNSSRVYVFGVPKAVPWVFNCMCRMLPKVAETTKVMKEYDDALDIVLNPSDVPDFWIYDDETSDNYGTVRTSTWCYERCLNDDNKVETKDVFNPAEWSYSECEEKAPSVKSEKHRLSLEIIEEADEDDEDSGW